MLNWLHGVTAPVQVEVPLVQTQPWLLHVVDDDIVEHADGEPEQDPPPASLAVQVQPATAWQDAWMVDVQLYGAPEHVPCVVTSVQPPQ